MNDLNTVEGFLKDVCAFLKKEDFHLNDSNSDGRINSSLDEDTVLDILTEKYSDYIEKMPPRSWCDFKHIPTNEPINFKSTSKLSSDNACNYLSLVHALTDIKFDDSRKPNSTKDKKELLTWLSSYRYWKKDDSYDNGRDYWFLVVNKNNTSDVCYNSVKSLEKITPNPSNPPFQINWGCNNNRKKRTFCESVDFIFETVSLTIQKQYENLCYDLVLEIKNDK